MNRNSEIDKAVRDGKPFNQFMPPGRPQPELPPRIVPDPDEDDREAPLAHFSFEPLPKHTQLRLIAPPCVRSDR
eukprot:7256389-Prymnesium_polylepis.1